MHVLRKTAERAETEAELKEFPELSMVTFKEIVYNNGKRIVNNGLLMVNVFCKVLSIWLLLSYKNHR